MCFEPHTKDLPVVQSARGGATWLGPANMTLLPLLAVCSRPLGRKWEGSVKAGGAQNLARPGRQAGLFICRVQQAAHNALNTGSRGWGRGRGETVHCPTMLYHHKTHVALERQHASYPNLQVRWRAAPGPARQEGRHQSVPGALLAWRAAADHLR